MENLVFNIDLVQKTAVAYTELCKPVCHEMKLSQTAFDILMFLSNNPQYDSASDVVKVRKLKANLVSVNINKLVEDGYLIREDFKNDRRKTRLKVTAKADSIVERGRKLQKKFGETLFANIDEQEKEVFFKVLKQMNSNLDSLLEKKGM